MRTFAAAASCLLVIGVVQADSVEYAIDPTHTFVNFEFSHFGTSTSRGRWDKKDGTVRLDRAARTGSVELTIDMNSINTGLPPFDRQLKNKDFFNIAEYPTAKFVANDFVFAGDQVTAVEGTLTLLGKSHPVTLKARRFSCYTSPIFRREVCGGDFEATLQRSLWGFAYGLPEIAPDAVRLVIQVEAIRQ